MSSYTTISPEQAFPIDRHGPTRLRLIDVRTDADVAATRALIPGAIRLSHGTPATGAAILPPLRHRRLPSRGKTLAGPRSLAAECQCAARRWKRL